MTRLTEVLPSSRISTNRLRTTLGVLLVVGLALGPAACERKDTAAKAITEAGRKLEAVSASGGTAPAYIESSMGTVRKDAKDIGSDPSAADTASSSLIAARAASGVAGVKAAQAADVEQEARRLGLVVYATLDAYGAQAEFAAGLEQFDPAQESKRITDEVTAKEQEISRAAAAKRQLQEEAAKLEADAQAALSSAQAERTTEAQIRKQAQDAGSQARTDLITQANQHRRTADGFDKKAADLRAQATVLAPRIERAQGELDHLTNQRKLLQDATAEVQALAQSGKQRAAEARAAVAKSAEDISTLVAKLESTRGEVDAPAKAAIDGYSNAAGEARKAAQGASREGASAAKMALAGYLSDAGAVAGARADGYRAYAALLEALAGAKPPLANASKYASAAAEARTAEKAARDDAKKFFEQAKDAVSGAGGGEELKAMGEKISARLEALAQGTVQPAKSLSLGGEASKGAASGDEGEIRALVSGLMPALRDGGLPAVLEMVVLPPGPIADLAPAVVELDAAMKEKFGSGMFETLITLGRERTGKTGDPFADMPMPNMDNLVIEISGDTALVTEKDDPDKLPLRKVDGKWKIDLAAVPQVQGFLPMAGPIATSLLPEFKALASDVRAGKFSDVTAFLQAAMPRLQKALGPMGAMLGGG